jgi:hypothetical protein
VPWPSESKRNKINTLEKYTTKGAICWFLFSYFIMGLSRRRGKKKLEVFVPVTAEHAGVIIVN